MVENTVTKNKGIEELIIRLRAGFCLFWIQTEEVMTVSEEIETALRDFNEGKMQKYSPFVWNLEFGGDPAEVLTKIEKGPQGTVGILLNYHWFVKDTTIDQMIMNRYKIFNSTQKAAIVVTNSGMDVLPAEIKGLFTYINFELPNEEELRKVLEIAVEVAVESPNFKALTPEEEVVVLRSAKGLTRQEAENAMFYSLVKMGKINHSMITNIKAKIVESEAGLEYSTFTESFDTLKGYDVLKSFTKQTIASEHARGILLLGPPGTGKSHFCKCLGNETNLPVLTLEMGAVFGSLVGESEKRMRRVIEIIKAMAPCILFVDEIEKGLAGVGGSGNNDGGTTKRTMGQFLKFLSDRPEGVYVVATCNNITQIPPEYLRAERWDTAPFFIDLPNAEEREQILNHYKDVYSVTGELNIKQTEGWSGAEIKALCRIANMMTLTINDAIKYIVPISSTMENEIKTLREWSKGKTLAASSLVETKKESRQFVNVMGQ